MAKKRKSIFEAATSQEEVKNAALQVQKEVLGTSQKSKGNQVPSPVQKNVTKKGKEKLMHLYVNKTHHTQAKLNATLRGMKLGEYIEWLIAQDKQSLNR